MAARKRQRSPNEFIEPLKEFVERASGDKSRAEHDSESHSTIVFASRETSRISKESRAAPTIHSRRSRLRAQMIPFREFTERGVSRRGGIAKGC